GVLGAVAAGLSSFALTPGSTIYVITDALSDDDYTDIETVLQISSYWKATINFLYTPEIVTCDYDLQNPGFRAYEEIANRLGGMAWRIDDKYMVFDVLYKYMHSIIYKSQLMLTLDRDECENGVWRDIHIEKNSYHLVFITRGSNFTLEIIGPSGETPSSYVIIEEGQFSVQKIPDGPAGVYHIRTHTTDPTTACSVRAYQTHDQELPTDAPTEAFWAVTLGLNTDNGLMQPLAGVDNHPMFHVKNGDYLEYNGLDDGRYVGYEDYDRSFAFLNMYAVREGVEQEVYASSGLYRDGCTFNFYFPSFRCRPNEILHYEFRLRSEVGLYIQRGGVMACSHREWEQSTLPTSPTTHSPTTAPPIPSGQGVYCDCGVDK
ncbi:hypothetical protein PENTCL1PPCAC_21458, partial [Pristionchus entomophagus]